MSSPEGRKFYGAVTVGERGQVAIPVAARRDFAVKPGDKLLVFGDLSQGIAFTTFELMSKTMAGAQELFREIDTTVESGETPKEE
jgi:AbrB family looped-hinge helix DNA binding protein